ncbi:MAG: AMP-dependent synthetase and ligase [Chthoniobacteraceae bacterium]|nr:AMP-dependent synthetase and ligase [Chthoniobacteraceae bacterium]
MKAQQHLHRLKVPLVKLSFLGGARLHAGVTAGEFLDAACRIDELLFTSEKRMALSADADLEVATSRTGVVSRPACACDRGFRVVGMDICFHGCKREVNPIGLPLCCNQKKTSNFVSESFPQNALLLSWKKTLSRCRDSTAIFVPNGSQSRTFSQIEEEAQSLARELAGLAPGSVAAVQIGNSVRWPALLIALFRARLIPLPLGRHMEAAELSAALDACNAAVLLTESAGRIQFHPCEPASPVCWDTPRPDFLKLTSGTTSAPRAIRFRAFQLLADCEQICSTMGIGRHDLNFGVIPFSHSYGFSNLLTPLIANGIPLVASEDRMPRAILNDLASSKATVFAGMPIFFQKFAELENLPALPHLRLCISAGAPLSKDVATRFSEKFGLKIHTFYGASECGGIGYDASDAFDYRDGFAGEPMRGVDVERVEGGASICVRSAAVGDGYFPIRDTESLENGRFVPSDLIRWDSRGMFIDGRVSDVINVAGRKLNPVELEQRLLLFPGVKAVVVFGVPSALRGEEPVACVATEQPGDTAAILRFCHTQFSPWQVPKDVWVVPEIPTNERGKISRRALIARYLVKDAP